MATLGGTVYTLADIKNTMDPDGKIARVIELMNRTNKVVPDILWKEGNLPTGHRVTVRSGLPTAYYRLLNAGIARSKDKTRQVDEACALLNANCVVDVDEAKLNGMSAAFMLSKNKAFIEAMTQKMVTSIFYGNKNEDPEEFTGFDPRYPYSDSPNVIDFGDSGSACASIWLVGWGENTVHGIYPKGSEAGLDVKDFDGKEFIVEDSDGNEYPAYRMWYTWKPGLCIEDWRYVVRIANIDTADFTGDAIRNALIDAYHTIPNLDACTPRLYCNQAIITALDKEAAEKSNVNYGINDAFGKPVLNFRGIPIQKCDALTSTETALTATP